MSMEAPRKLVSAALLLVLLLAATGEMGGPVAVAEARTCEAQSHRFKGPCLRKSNCAGVCRTEGFPGGHCRGARRRCFCTTHCR
uniref:Defensin 14 n=1 Tax=Avena sativa TaxID=4498 RepID=A0A2L0U0X5_AVESA|nr:defensin 14 [Avena sativa]